MRTSTNTESIRGIVIFILLNSICGLANVIFANFCANLLSKGAPRLSEIERSRLGAEK